MIILLFCKVLLRSSAKLRVIHPLLHRKITSVRKIVIILNLNVLKQTIIWRDKPGTKREYSTAFSPLNIIKGSQFYAP